ncbi:DUF3331 domain-containing protein [Burkholderia sp. RF2-non_BP3]|uniref:DUF3331 domain-containing protein n=1 Tax=Burkholderia sp. RF2-non_BP3 TaxID=1637844 RepID=UPI00075447C7|nr:DUF3331 domain-containing protein [Burkholderia sp. RF2-non_BP3]KUY62056.1 hypothetical protein WS45_04170 [Burkholderia sp. RF2-non_BP3]
MMELRTNATDVDPWTQTLGLLTQLCAPRDVRASARPREARRTRAGADARNKPHAISERRAVAISVVERHSATTVSIAWRDATRCSYGDQVWQTARARVGGVCAVSGCRIEPGDPVYRPRPTRPVPINAGAMILASMLEQIEETA